MILTGNYGEAGAIERYGPGFGLPAVDSGTNNFWLWGPPPATDTSAPRGWYMLFIADNTGVPSVATWIHLPA